MSSTKDNTRTRRETRARHGFFPLVIGEQVDVAQAGAVALVAGNDLHLSQGGGSALFAGNRIIIEKGGGNFLAAGSGISIEQGGAGFVVAPDVKFAKSYVGIALGGSIDIADDSRLIMGGREAVIVGVAMAGAAVAFRAGAGALRRWVGGK